MHIISNFYAVKLTESRFFNLKFDVLVLFCVGVMKSVSYRTTFGCWSSLRREISLTEVLGTPSSSLSRRIFFIATTCPVVLFLPLYTTPYVPNENTHIHGFQLDISTEKNYQELLCNLIFCLETNSAHWEREREAREQWSANAHIHLKYWRKITHRKKKDSTYLHQFSLSLDSHPFFLNTLSEEVQRIEKSQFMTA